MSLFKSPELGCWFPFCTIRSKFSSYLVSLSWFSLHQCLNLRPSVPSVELVEDPVYLPCSTGVLRILASSFGPWNFVLWHIKGFFPFGPWGNPGHVFPEKDLWGVVFYPFLGPYPSGVVGPVPCGIIFPPGGGRFNMLTPWGVLLMCAQVW